MTWPSASFQFGDMITGEPHLYVANSSSPPSDAAVAAPEAPVQTSLVKQSVAIVRRTFRLGFPSGDALAAGHDRAFKP
jgi:hypothetical protein